jgi:hypothetical protein
MANLLLSVALAQQINDTQTYIKNPKLESVLSQLASATNPQEFALAHNLYMVDGKVRVIIKLASDSSLLPDYIVEETRYKNEVQILVPVEKIVALTLEGNVTFMRAPLKPYADAPITTGVPNKTLIQTPIPKSGFGTAIPVIISMILVILIRKTRGDKNVKK